MRRSLASRVARLEAAQPAGNGLFGVHIGGTDFVTCNGQDIPLDEWRRRYSDAVTIDIAYSDWPPETGDGVKALRGVSMAEL